MRIEKLWIYAFSLTLHKIGGGQHRDVVEIKRQQKNKLTRHSFTITRKIMIWFSRLTFLYIKYEAYLKLPAHNIYCRYNFCCSVKE